MHSVTQSVSGSTVSTPRRRRLRAALVLPALAMIGTTVLVSGTASATVPNASLVGSYCTGYMNWAGAIPSTGPANYQVSSQPRGTVRTCFFKYRINDQDTSGDYYAGEAVTEWTLAGGTVSQAAPMSQSISSNRATVSGVYASTPSLVGQSCTNPFTVGITLGIFSMSTTPTVCSGTTVARTVYSPTAGIWQNSTAGRLRSVETQFSQKVAEGTVPIFNFSSVIPQYLVNSCPVSGGSTSCTATTTARSTTVAWSR